MTFNLKPTFKTICVLLTITITIIIAIALTLSFSAYADAANINSPYFTVEKGGNLNGFWVECKNNLDYPSAINSSAKQIEQEAKEIVATAVKYGYNSIFYTVTPEAAAMYNSKYLPSSRFTTGTQGAISLTDPLKLLVQNAEKNNVDVCAVISPLYLGSADILLDKTNLAAKNPDWTILLDNNRYYNPAKPQVQVLAANIAGELLSHYKLSGIAVDFTECDAFTKDEAYYASLRLILQNCFRNINKQNYDSKLGVILNANIITDYYGIDFVSQLTENHVVDFILPDMNYSVSGENLYGQALQKWQDLSINTKTQIFTLNNAGKILSPSDDGIFFGDAQEINFQQYVNTMTGVNGSVVRSFKNLRFNAYQVAQDLSSTGFVDKNLVRTLTFDKNNNFSIAEPDTTTPNLNATDSTDEFVAYPEFDDALLVKEPLSFECTAPSGSVVTARFRNQVYTLSQTDTKIPIGEPAAYKATVNLSSFTEDSIVDAGSVTYTISYKSKTMVQTSAGKITLIGNTQQLAIKVADEFAPIYENPENSSKKVVTNILKKDTCDYVASNKNINNNDFFELKSGGFIKKSAVTVLTDSYEISSIKKEIKNVVVQSIPKGEYVTLAGGGGLPCALSYDEESRVLSIKLHNITSIPQNLKHLKSELFNSITVKQEENSTTVLLGLREEQNLYGYYIAFNEGNLILYCKSHFLPEKEIAAKETAATPDSSLATKPLSGFNVIIDPGHGGKSSSGTFTNSSGISEADLNLAASLAIANRLQAHGATVTLTRNNDSPISDIDRIMLGEYQDSDLFISIHHSYSNNKNNNNSGVTVAYNQTFAEPFARNLSDSLSKRLNRKNNELIKDNAYITQISMSPAVQIDLGYLTNPDEYVHLIDSLELYRSACIITQEVLKMAIK